MICKKYLELLPQERIQVVGKLIHLIQSNPTYLLIAQQMIREGEENGCFDKVVINPANDNDE